MAMNVIYYEWDKNGKPRRLVDKISKLMNNLGLYGAVDYWPIENSDNKTIGALYTVDGSYIVTKFLSWITKYHGKGENCVSVIVDNNGQVIKVEDKES